MKAKAKVPGKKIAVRAGKKLSRRPRAKASKMFVSSAQMPNYLLESHPELGV